MLNTNRNILSYIVRILLDLPRDAYFSVDAANNMQLPKDWGFTKRVNTNHHIAYIKSGSVKYLVNNHIHILKQGDLIYIPPYVAHDRIIQDETTHVILLRFDILSKKDHPLNLEQPLSFSYHFDTATFILKSLMDICNTYKPSTPVSVKHAGVLLTDLFYKLHEHLTLGANTTLYHPKLKLAVDYISTHINETISTDQHADIAQLSTNYFRRQFFKHYGINPRTYHIRAKIQYACRLMDESDLTLKEIAHRLGYSDAFAFSKQFKKHLGLSPSSYRTNNIMT